MSEREKTLVEALLSNAEWINNVLFVGLTLCLVMVILKILGKGEEFEIFTIKIPTRYFWIVILSMTLAHLYSASIFNTNGLELFFNSGDEARQTAFYKLTKTGPLFFRGLVPRIQLVNGFVVMDMSDPTTWIAHLASILVFASLIRWKNVRLRARVFSILIAVVLTVFNWGIGSNWAIAASELSLASKEKSFFYNRLRASKNIPADPDVPRGIRNP